MVIAGWLLLMVVSLAVLIRASDFFVVSAEKVGIQLGLPTFVVGVVIVGFGTSLPELVSSIASVRQHSSEIVIGNVLGSNISNILLVLGLAGIIAREFTIRRKLMPVDIPFLLGSAVLVAWFVYDRDFTVTEAVISLAVLAAYLVLTYLKRGADIPEIKERAGLKSWLILLLCPLVIFFAANYTVKAVIALAMLLKIGTEVIALSVVALGTSLPEVSVSISAARRGNPDMVVGNVIGSNIFNTFAVMGIARFFGVLAIPSGIITFSLPLSIMVTVAVILVVMDKKVFRWEGLALIVGYATYIFKLFFDSFNG